MKIYNFLIITLTLTLFVNCSNGQSNEQNNSANLNEVYSIKTNNPSIEETQDWIKEKMEMYSRKRISRIVEFNNDNIIIYQGSSNSNAKANFQRKIGKKNTIPLSKIYPVIVKNNKNELGIFFISKSHNNNIILEYFNDELKMKNTTDYISFGLNAPEYLNLNIRLKKAFDYLLEKKGFKSKDVF